MGKSYVSALLLMLVAVLVKASYVSQSTQYCIIGAGPAGRYTTKLCQAEQAVLLLLVHQSHTLLHAYQRQVVLEVDLYATCKLWSSGSRKLSPCVHTVDPVPIIYFPHLQDCSLGSS